MTVAGSRAAGDRNDSHVSSFLHLMPPVTITRVTARIAVSGSGARAPTAATSVRDSECPRS